MYDQIIKCLVFEWETKSFSPEAVKPGTLAHLTCFLACVWCLWQVIVCGDFAGCKWWKKLFILLFRISHPRKDFYSPFEDHGCYRPWVTPSSSALGPHKAETRHKWPCMGRVCPHVRGWWAILHLPYMLQATQKHLLAWLYPIDAPTERCWAEQ